MVRNRNSEVHPLLFGVPKNNCVAVNAHFPAPGYVTVVCKHQAPGALYHRHLSRLQFLHFHFCCRRGHCPLLSKFTEREGERDRDRFIFNYVICTHECESLKRALDPLQLELQVTESHPQWVLGTNSGSPTEAALCTISPAPEIRSSFHFLASSVICLVLLLVCGSSSASVCYFFHCLVSHPRIWKAL